MNTDAVVVGFYSVTDAMLVWIGQALLLGTVVAGLTWLLLRALRGRTSPALTTALWSIVLIKFLVPFGPGWSLSLASVWNRVATEATVGLVAVEMIDTSVESPTTTAIAGALDEKPKSGKLASHWPAIVAVAYLLGAAALSVARWRGYLAFRAHCRALPVAGRTTGELVRCVCQRLGVRRVPRVHLTEEPRVAFVLGVRRPLLVISRSYLVRPDEVETVVVHEVTHLRRGDMFVRCLQCVAGTVLFFWPVVAWVNRRIDRAREHACDEWALRYGRLTASEYARCLLSAVRPTRSHSLTYHPACMAGTSSTIERRIDVILTLPSRRARRPIWGLLTIAILATWAGFILTDVATAKGPAQTGQTEYLATEEDMTRHAQAVYARVNELAGGDQDGDGKVTKEECWAYLTAAMLLTPDVTLERYPQADRNDDGQLDLAEVYLLVRGDDDVKHGGKKRQAAVEDAIKAGDKDLAKRTKTDSLAEGIMVWHMILDRREQMLDEMSDRPSTEMVEQVTASIAELEIKWTAKGKSDKLAYTMSQMSELKAKAEQLRQKAAEMNGEDAEAYVAKAEQLEQKAALLKEKVIAHLEEVIAKHQSHGNHKISEQLAAKLAELQSE